MAKNESGLLLKKISKILLIATVAALLIGVVLTVLTKSLFIFIFLPFGLGWGVSRKTGSQKGRDSGAQFETQGSADPGG